MPEMNIRRKGEETIVTVCDSELLGKKLEDGKLKLEVDKEFYEGEKVSVEECLEAIENATIANLVGSIIEPAIDAGYISEDHVLTIEEVKHAQLATP